MNRILLLCVLVALAFSSHHLRHNAQNNQRTSKVFAQTSDVEYIDDDAVYVEQSADSNN